MVAFRHTACFGSRALVALGLLSAALEPIALTQTVTIDTSTEARGQVIDGFGTYVTGTEAEQAWWQNEVNFEEFYSSCNTRPPGKRSVFPSSTSLNML